MTRPAGAGLSSLLSSLRNALPRRKPGAAPPSPLDERLAPIAELVQAAGGPDADRSAAVDRLYRHSVANGWSEPVQPAPIGAVAAMNSLDSIGDARAFRDFVVSDLLAGSPDAEAVRAWSAVRFDIGANRRLRGSASSFEPMDLGGLREYVRDRSVALVADSSRLAGTGLGARIDACDVVIRFDAFAIDEEHTGARTQVHVTANVNSESWEVPVDVRIVMAGSVRTWRSGIIAHLVPTAQRFVGSEVLRWPLHSPSVLGEPKSGHESSLAFQTARLLDFLGVAARLEIYGFPADGSGPAVAEERSWLTGGARAVEETVITLGPGAARGDAS
jgi:hypothetical protein